ncbi:restriction endonuclease [Thermithiobacillus tepidarius DSM 3134]|uniref:restriction endonuclease n=1 Tax=Thermithiobacillus tepidarius TaxID=929 RepID=UPI000404960B|nr:restriction endonuclease [Thermithiobacillus tepidarius]
MAGAQLIRALAQFGQYLLPAAFLIGAVLSALKQRQRGQLVEQTRARGQQSALLDMNWREFEMLVGEACRRKGYGVVETGGHGPDGGVDLVLRKGGELYLVKCKQWKALKVGVDVVRALYGVMAARGATGGFVVTAGRFTADARAFAQGRNIELIEGEQLLAMIQGAKSAGMTQASTPAASQAPAAPACPRCGAAMVRRTARQGGNAGRAFWGCSAFPACRGTTAIE